MALPPHVSAIVFDCDGLLLDTESCWSRAEAALFADHGFGFGPAEKDLLIGRTLEAAWDNMAAYFGMPGAGPQLLADLVPRVEAELSAQVEPTPGTRRLLEYLHGRVSIAVATNSPRAMLTAALKSSGLADFFEVSVAADEVQHAKPHPELLSDGVQSSRRRAANGRCFRGFIDRRCCRPCGTRVRGDRAVPTR